MDTQKKKTDKSYSLFYSPITTGKKRINVLLDKMKKVEFHFVLEGISGKGKKFLIECISEAKIFKNAKIIDSKNTSWTKLYNKLKKNKK